MGHIWGLSMTLAVWKSQHSEHRNIKKTKQIKWKLKQTNRSHLQESDQIGVHEHWVHVVQQLQSRPPLADACTDGRIETSPDEVSRCNSSKLGSADQPLMELGFSWHPHPNSSKWLSGLFNVNPQWYQNQNVIRFTHHKWAEKSAILQTSHSPSEHSTRCFCVLVPAPAHARLAAAASRVAIHCDKRSWQCWRSPHWDSNASPWHAHLPIKCLKCIEDLQATSKLHAATESMFHCLNHELFRLACVACPAKAPLPRATPALWHRNWWWHCTSPHRMTCFLSNLFSLSNFKLNLI